MFSAETEILTIIFSAGLESVATTILSPCYTVLTLICSNLHIAGVSLSLSCILNADRSSFHTLDVEAGSKLPNDTNFLSSI